MKSTTWMSILMLLAVMCPFSSVCQTTQNKIDQVVSTLFKSDGPGGTVIAARDGKVIYRKAFGMANLELGVKMQPDYIFRIGSLTKQFTACAILKLAEEGKLSLQDTINKYIPDFPMHGRKIRVENLLTHTSGIHEYTAMSEFGTKVKRTDLSPKALIDFFKNEPLDFEPGTAMRYCNSNYVLLGYIIEKISGKAYSEYIDENFFKPLGMNHSSYDSTSKMIPGRIAGYTQHRGIYQNADFLSMTLPYSAGSLLSNIDDLYKWYEGLRHHKVISPNNLAKAFTSYRLTTKNLTGCGYGWWVGNIQGHKAVKHSGKINGFLTFVLFLTEDNTFVAIFSNCDNRGDLEYPASKIAAILLGKPYEFLPVKLPESELQPFQGVYVATDSSNRIIRCEDGVLQYFARGGAKVPLIAVGQNKLLLANSLTTLTFEKNRYGTIKGFNQEGTGQPEIWCRTRDAIAPIKRIQLDSTTLEKFAGQYEFPGGLLFDIVREAHKLYGQVGLDKKEILPCSENQFFAKELDAMIIFSLDKKGQVTGLTKIQNSEMKAKKIR